MAWFYLALTIAFDVIGMCVSKITAVNPHTAFYFLRAMLLVLTHITLILALRKLDIGFTYALWSGLGIVLMVIVSAVFFNEHLTYLKIFGITLIMIGTICLSIVQNN